MSDVATTAVEAAKSLPPSTVDALRNALIDIITGTVQSAGEAKQFVLAQVPDVIQQLVTFYTVWYAVTAVMFLAIVITLFVLLVKYFKSAYVAVEKATDDVFPGIVAVVYIVFTGFMTTVLCCAVKDFLMVYIMPKVWLIQYAVTLVQEIKK